jgi:hypothetical protein
LISFKKMERKSLAIKIGPAGVEVRLPRWASVRDPGLRKDLLKHLAKLAAAMPQQLSQSPVVDRASLLLEIGDWSAALKVQPKRVQVRQLSSRWASCTSLGNLTFSDRILEMPPALREYLICHELNHLRVLNHGPDFRRLMSQAMPDWKKRQEWLVSWMAARELATLRVGRRSKGTRMNAG